MKTRVVNSIPEWRYQAEVIARLHKMEANGSPLTCAGDMNAGKRGRGAKVTGLTAGEPDIRIYLSGGRLLSVEMKRPKGTTSKEQKARHNRLVELGFEVIVVAAATPKEAADLAEKEVMARLFTRE